MMIEKIISGCQTGADCGGLKAAECLGLQTGGYVTKDFRAEDGSCETLAKHFGLIEAASRDYSTRTKLNVKFSDGTVIFGNMEISKGSKLTVKYCIDLVKPVLYIRWPTQYDYLDNIPTFIGWIKQENIKILNVAGNRESSVPGLEQATINFLVKALK